MLNQSLEFFFITLAIYKRIIKCIYVSFSDICSLPLGVTYMTSGLNATAQRSHSYSFMALRRRFQSRRARVLLSSKSKIIILKKIYGDRNLKTSVAV